MRAWSNERLGDDACLEARRQHRLRQAKRPIRLRFKGPLKFCRYQSVPASGRMDVYFFWSGGVPGAPKGKVPNMFLVWLCICSCIWMNRFLLCSM